MVDVAYPARFPFSAGMPLNGFGIGWFHVNVATGLPVASNVGVWYCCPQRQGLLILAPCSEIPDAVSLVVRDSRSRTASRAIRAAGARCLPTNRGGPGSGSYQVGGNSSGSTARRANCRPAPGCRCWNGFASVSNGVMPVVVRGDQPGGAAEAALAAGDVVGLREASEAAAENGILARSGTRSRRAAATRDSRCSWPSRGAPFTPGITSELPAPGTGCRQQLRQKLHGWLLAFAGLDRIAA